MKVIKEVIRTGILAAVLALCGTAYAQSPHGLTYTQVSVAPGTKVTIQGMEMVSVQVPVRQFTMDKRYAVRFLAPLFSNGEEEFVAADIYTQHSNAPLENANATIDGVPVRIDVLDGRTYGVHTGIDELTFLTTNRLQVESNATALVTAKLGDTLLTYYCSFYQTDHDVALGLNEYRGTAQAAYGRYTDPVNLISQANGLDKCIDYLRIIALN